MTTTTMTTAAAEATASKLHQQYYDDKGRRRHGTGTGGSAAAVHHRHRRGLVALTTGLVVVLFALASFRCYSRSFESILFLPAGTYNSNKGKRKEAGSGSGGRLGGGRQQQIAYSVLLPREMDHYKRGLPQLYGFDEIEKPTTAAAADNNNTSCSCLNSSSTSECCERIVLQTHKFGYELARKALSNVPKGAVARHAVCGRCYGETAFDVLPLRGRNRNRDDGIDDNADDDGRMIDFRLVLTVRDIYDALISGYLYHLDGTCIIYNRWRMNSMAGLSRNNVFVCRTIVDF